VRILYVVSARVLHGTHDVARLPDSLRIVHPANSQ
jgi:hypothetical protein